MNGLQSVSVSLGKGIRCLPIYPPGTRGRILSRRLTHAAQSQQTPPAHHLRAPLDADAVRSISKATAEAVHRLQYVLGEAVYEFRRAPPPPSPAPVSKEPLDPTLTGLNPIVTPRRNSLIGSLLHAIDRRQDAAIWNRFMETCSHFLTLELNAHQFSALLLSLRAERFVQLRARHRLDRNGNPYLVSEEEAFREFKEKIGFLIKTMRSASHRLSAREYHHLIDCSRAGKDPKMADEFWNHMCGNNVPLDTWTYNSYLAALGGGSATVEREFRVSEKSLEHRAMRKPEDMRKRAHRIYNNMARKRISPSSMTFDILMLAMARMGDVDGVETTLKKVWDVDVHALPDEAAVSDKRTAFSTESPLYPTGNTLLAVATSFCQNGLVDVAVRAVDHISRRYDIQIKVPTWVVLLNWTYVYTRQRKADVLPGFAMERLWNIMTSEPYKVSPTPDMYDYIVRSYLWRGMPEMAERMMDLALIAASKQTLRKADEIGKRISHGRTIRTPLDDLEGLDAKKDHSEDDINKLSEQVSKLVRDQHRLRSMVRRWSELLVLGKGLDGTTFGPQKVPGIIDKWRDFLGNEVVYVLGSGHVELNLDTEGRRWRPIGTRKRRWYYMALGTGSKEEDDFF